MGRVATIILILLLNILSLNAQVDDSLEYQMVGPEDFLTMIRFRENAVLIDVRLPFEFRKERIENAINIPVTKNLKKRTARLGINKEAVLLLYCTTDVRSNWAALRLYDLGFRNLYSLKGGIEAWKRKGLPVIGKRYKAQGSSLRKATDGEAESRLCPPK
jgi:rhodanese-related sulfurtransferase